MTNSVQSDLAENAGAKTQVPWERIERFVGQLTHDVRNGLNALELQLTFLGEISTDPEAIEEVKRIRGSLADITRHLQAVRTATGTISLHQFDYPAIEFFEDLKERFERSQSALKDRLQWRIQAGTEALAIDPEQTMAALLELLANASHFSAADNVVVFEAKMDGATVVITVSEPCSTPPTVSVAEWGRTPFLSTRRAAYGLGLFRVRRIVESQKGSFDVAYSAAEQALVSRVTLLLAVPS